MGHDAVGTLIGCAGGDHDHLPLNLGQAIVLVHEGVVVGEERPGLIGPAAQRRHHIGGEAQLGADEFRPIAKVIGQIGNGGHRKPGRLRHSASLFVA